MQIRSVEDQTPMQRQCAAKVADRFKAADRLHSQYRDRWDVFYGLLRNYRKLKRTRRQAANEPDRDSVMDEFKRVFGVELFIPYAFATVETVLPRMLSNDPRMLSLPLEPEAEDDARPVKHLFERDQAAIGYEMKLQETARNGLIYGLGVQKSYWEKRMRNGRTIRPATNREKLRALLPGQDLSGYVSEQRPVLVYEGPQIEAVDPFDFFWDPAAKDIDSAHYLIQRVWLSHDDVCQRVKSGAWFDLDLSWVEGLASDRAFGETREGRYTAAGIPNFNASGGPKMHEVWEYHDRDVVYTILDKQVLVQAAANPHAHGDFPFQIFRPTPVPNEFVGMGEIEPIAHLQFELNTMRTQRRDAAIVALNRGYFYQQGFLDPKNAATGPGVFVPVLGDPREAVQPMPIADIPASSVSEEEALKADIERTSGISDPATSNAPAGETATGQQMVMAQANERIRQKAKNLANETIRPAAAQWLSLYRGNLLRDVSVRVEADTPEGYEWVKVGPRQLNANIEVIPEGGSIEPENVAQKRADAIALLNGLVGFAQNDGPVDAQKLVLHVLEEFAIKRPNEWLRKTPDAGAQVQDAVQAIGQRLSEAGMPNDQITQLLSEAAQGAQPNSAAPPEPAGVPS